MADITLDPRGAGSPSGASTIDEAKRQKLLELVRGRALARPTDLAEDEVMVWPSLVWWRRFRPPSSWASSPLLSIFVSAPLTERANANQTPNPSKAPWYFLNLQELLLHMDAGLAGVIVPSVALGAIAAIPYIDRSPLGVGILGHVRQGPEDRLLQLRRLDPYPLGLHHRRRVHRRDPLRLGLSATGSRSRPAASSSPRRSTLHRHGRHHRLSHGDRPDDLPARPARRW
jgi:hypothetical protein